MIGFDASSKKSVLKLGANWADGVSVWFVEVMDTHIFIDSFLFRLEPVFLCRITRIDQLFGLRSFETRFQCPDISRFPSNLMRRVVTVYTRHTQNIQFIFNDIISSAHSNCRQSRRMSSCVNTRTIRHVHPQNRSNKASRMAPNNVLFVCAWRPLFSKLSFDFIFCSTLFN